MTRTLSTPTQSAEQYVTFTSAEAIQAGDIVALGYSDGKAYYLNDPAVSDTAANRLRNFALANRTTPSQYKPVTSVAGSGGIPGSSTGTGWAKTAQLSNGNTVLVGNGAVPAAYIPNTATAGVTTVAAGLYFTIVDANGLQVAGPAQISGLWTALQNPHQISSGVFSAPAATGVTVIALPAGGFVVSYVEYTAGNSQPVSLNFKTYSNAGVLTGSGIVKTATANPYASTAFAYFKMALLSNGNLVFAYAMNQQSIYDGTGAAAQVARIFAYSHGYAIFTPAGPVITNAGLLGGPFAIGALYQATQAGAWVGTRPFSTQLLTFPNGNWALVGVQIDYGYTLPAVASRSLVCNMMTSTGAYVSQSATPMNTLPYSTTGAMPRADTEGYVLGCVLSSGSALLHAGGYDGTSFLYSLSQTGVVTMVRNGVNAYLDAVDAGDGGVYNQLPLMTNGFFDLYPYGMYPLGTGALLVSKTNEQILNAAGATVSTGSAIPAQNKPILGVTSAFRWQSAPLIMTTNFGQFMTLQSVSLNGVLPIVPITGGGFGTPVVLPVSEGLVKSVTTIANPQSTPGTCYQVVAWDRFGYVNTFGVIDAIQGMTFVGVAKNSANKDAPVSVQTYGQAKLRISISQPMIVDTRFLLNAGASAQQNIAVQGNTLGTLATLFGDTATLKGNT